MAPNRARASSGSVTVTARDGRPNLRGRPRRRTTAGLIDTVRSIVARRRSFLREKRPACRFLLEILQGRDSSHTASLAGARELAVAELPGFQVRLVKTSHPV